MRIPSIEPLEARIAPAVLSLAGPVSVTEGEVGQSDITFKVLLDIPSPTPLTVEVNTLDGTATVADGDYSALTHFIVTIPANTVEKTFVVKVTGDTKFEPDENFSVALSNPSGTHTLGATTTAVGTILNGIDAAPKLSITAASVKEGDSGTAQMKFTVSMTNASSQPVTFVWSTQDASTGASLATAGVDYTAVSGATATIDPGKTSVEIVVDVTSDTAKEANETFDVQLSNPVMGATFLQFVTGKDKATGTIINDEPDVTLDLLSSPTGNEGTSSTETTVNFAVKLSVAASEDTEVFVSTVDGTATAGLDFTALVNQRFVIQKGQTQITVPVKVAADSIFESNESFSLKLDDVKRNGVTIDFPTAALAVTLTNDDAQPTISVAGAMIQEPATGSQVMNFTVTLSGPADKDVTFSWNTADISGQATAGADYNAVMTTATILAGQTTVQLPVTILSDALTGEGSEQFRVQIASPMAGAVPLSVAVGGGQALGTIRVTPLGVSAVGPAAAVTEGSSGGDRDAIFRITRGPSDSMNEAVTVWVSTVDGEATSGGASSDYTALSGAKFTIPVGLPDVVVEVKVHPDTQKEINETFSLRIDRVEVANAAYDGIVTATASATIADDDSEPTLSVGNASVVEFDSGTHKLSFVVTMSNAADTAVTFEYVTVLDTGANAADAADFTQVLVPVTVTIPAGTTSKTVEVDVTGDLARETSETFLVRISKAFRGTTELSITDTDATMTIVDDDPNVSIMSPTTATTVLEGTSPSGKTNFNFTLKLDKAASENIAIHLTTIDGTAGAGTDFDATDKWIIILAGATTGTLSVPVSQDSRVETSETFSVRVGEVRVGVNAALDVNGQPVDGGVLAQDAIADSVATITDDDVVALSISDASIVEGNGGTSQLKFTVTMPLVASRDVTFDYKTSDNTALGGIDFAAISGLTGTIPAGSTSVDIFVDINGDATTEADETFTVTISNAKVGADSATIADQFGTGTIFNDEQTVSINATLSVAENVVGSANGNVALMTVTLSSVSAFPVMVNLSLTNGTALKGSDFSDPSSLTVTIPAGQTTTTVSVPLTGDGNFELDETFDVYLIGSTNAQLGAVTQGTVTITNDDVASLITITAPTVSEGNPASETIDEFTNLTFTVTLDKAAGAPITFDWETLSGSPYTATPGSDFTAVSINTFTIPANTTSTSFVVKVKKDNIFESNETVGVFVSNVMGGLLAAPDTVGGASKTLTGTIQNDEAAPTLSISNESQISEGDSGTTIKNFTVTLSRAADQDVTFFWRTAVGGGNAGTEGTDYVKVSVELVPVTILAGSKSATLGVTIMGDTDVETDETFLVQIVDPRIGTAALVGGTLEATGTIRDDDITAKILPVDAVVSTTEGNDLVDVLIPVTLSQAVPVGQTVTVGFEIGTGTGVTAAISGTDFQVPASSLLVFAAGETVKNIVVKVRPDAISELNETFTVKLKNSTSHNVKVESAVDDSAVVTIVDNDPAPTISITDVGVNESAGTMVFTVTLDREASSLVEFDVNTIDGMAMVGNAISTGALFDFTALVAQHLSITPGQTSKTFSVAVRSDLDASEGVEKFTVRLSGAVVGVFEGAGATLDAIGSIADADVSSISITDASRVEGSNAGSPAKLVFTVSRPGSTAKEVTANYTISFDALLASGVSAADMADIVSALTGTVTIPAGQASKTIEVELTGDGVAEGNEAFKITLSNPVNAFFANEAAQSAVGTILEDDVTVRFRNGTDVARPAVISQAEGNAVAANMEFFVDLNQIATTDVVVTFTLADGTAAQGSDYTTPSVLTLTILKGMTSGSLLVPITADAVAEGKEDFTVTISSATGATVDSANSTRTGEITNDDATFTVLSGARVIEGNSGTRNLVFQVMLADAEISVGTQYSVDFTTVNGTAIAGQDYTVTTDTLIFTDNGIMNVSVPVTGDTAAENDEQFELVISNAKQNTQSITAILTARATGTIQDDEFNVSIGSATLTEGDSGQQQMIFVISLPVAATHPVVIKYITVNGTAVGAAPGATDLTGKDYRSVTDGTLTIPANQRTAQISIPVFGDRVNEPTETFTVKFTQVSGAVAVVDEGTGTITDNNDPLPTLSIADSARFEGDSGPSIMKFRVLLSEVANADVTFTWSTALGTASATDFVEQVNQTGTIPAGSKFVDIEVPLSPDALVEGDEKFTVTISNGVRGATPNTSTLTITDALGEGTIQDDDGVLRIKAGSELVAVDEDDGAVTPVGNQAKVMLDITPISGAFTVTYTITAPTDPGDVAAKAAPSTVTATSVYDYELPSTTGTFTKTFAAGTAAADLFIGVNLKGDTIDEWDEKFVVTITGVTGAKLDSTAANLKSVVTITDDDAAPTVQISDITVQESAVPAKFVVKLVGNVTERDVTIKWSSLADTALAVTDFAELTDQTLIIAAGQREGDISVALVNDTLDEPDEKFRVSLVQANFTKTGTIGEEPGFVGGIRNGIATIAQNDLRTVTVSGGSVVEGIAGVTTTVVNFTIRLDSAPSSTPVKVNYSTVAGTAFAGSDFVATTGQVIFAPGETSKTVAISVVSDDVAELDEQFKLQISIPSDGFALLSGNNEATATIEADESVFKLVRVDPGAVTEGGAAKFKVERTGALNFSATVSYSTFEVATSETLRAIAGTDFVANTNGTISFAAGVASSSEFSISTINDSIAELDGDKFLVRLTNAVNGIISATTGENEATVVINDNDVPADPFARIDGVVAREGSNLSFVVKLVNAAGNSVTAAYPVKVSYMTLLAGTGAVANATDFPAGFSDTEVKFVTIPTGQSQITITVAVQQDSTPEADETMTVRLTKLEKNFGGLTEITNPFLPVGATTPATATIDAIGKIRNEDSLITVAAVSQSEGNAALSDMTFVATIPAATSFPVSFHFKTKNGTADATDFDAQEGDVTILAGETQATIVIKVKGDMIREGADAFTLELSAPVNGIFGASETAVVNGTIVNDDPGPLLTISGGDIDEGNAGDANADLVFTVTLTGQITQNVTVNFESANGTASSSGVLQDYIATQGLLTFTPGSASTQLIHVKVIGDKWKEGNETLTVNISGATGGAEIVTRSAVGTILDGGDSTIGVSLKGTSTVEGGNAVFTVELTSLGAGTMAFKGSTRSGSADTADITGATDKDFSIDAAAAKTGTITVATRQDTTFEASETFHLDLSGLPSGFEFIPGGSSAQAIIYNDDQRIISGREFEFIDEDGDLVNIKVSKGALFAPNQFGVLTSRGIVTLAAAGSVGGQSISSINFLGTGREFEGANLTVSRKPQAGYDRPTDGQVNVGEVIAAQSGFASLQQGVYLGTVKIDGDLGRIQAGSTLTPKSISKLEVGSLGVIDRTGDGASQTVFFGSVGSILVHGDVEGTIFAVGSSVNLTTGFLTGLGAIGKITIEGQLVGGATENAGYISSNSKIGAITVGGIVGGTGVDTGKIQASRTIGSFTALGDVSGGEGIGSGQVIGSSIGKVQFGKAGRRGVPEIRANLIGGDAGPDSELAATQILAQVGSGAIVSFSGIGSVNMNGDIQGGSGSNSGMIFANRNVGKIAVGDIIGGEGESSGRIGVFGGVKSFSAGTIQGSTSSMAGRVQITGRIGNLTIGNLLGTTDPSEAGSSINRAGSIAAGDIGKILVTGDIKAATGTGGEHLGSASIFSAQSIGSLTVKGSVEGADVAGGVRAVVISAGGNIGNVNIGTMRFAEILAGYGPDETGGTFTTARGTLRNGDAQIGKVTVGTFSASSIVAGVDDGGDDSFGTSNDVVPQTGITNSAKLISRIASVTILNALAGNNTAGIVAQAVGTVKVAGVKVIFGADELKEIADGTNVFINEV